MASTNASTLLAGTITPASPTTNSRDQLPRRYEAVLTDNVRVTFPGQREVRAETAITRFGGSSGSARAYFARGRSSAAIRWNSEKRLRIVCSWFCLPETRTLMTYSACSAASPQKRGAWWAMSTSSMATDATASRRRGGHVERRDDEVSTAKG